MELIGSVLVPVPADYTRELRVYMEIAGEIVKHAAPWVKTAKAQLQATGCAGGSSYCTRRSARIRLRDQIESEDSRSCGSTTVLSAVAARALAGNCRLSTCRLAPWAFVGDCGVV
jgi:hypothetical protein